MDTNRSFEELMKDEDIIKVARKAAMKFVNQLSPEEIENCILIAVWKSMQKHDLAKGLKFTTFLYRGVIMECLTQKKLNVGTHKVQNLICDKHVVDRRDDCSMVDALDEIANDPNRDILVDKYLNNYSTKEIAQSRGVCLETIRKKIFKSKKKREVVAC